MLRWPCEGKGQAPGAGPLPGVSKPRNRGPPETAMQPQVPPLPLAPTCAAPKRQLLPSRLPNTVLAADRLSLLSLKVGPPECRPHTWTHEARSKPVLWGQMNERMNKHAN